MKSAKKIMKEQILSNLKYIIMAFIATLIIQLLALIPPQIMKRIIDTYIVDKNMKAIYISIVFMVGIPILSTLINVIYTSTNAWAAKKISTGLSRKIFLNNIRQPLDFFDENKSGELTTHSGAEFSGFINFWLIDVPNTLVNAIIIVFILISLFKINSIVTLIQILSVPLFLIPTFYLSNRTEKYISKIMELLSAALIGLSFSILALGVMQGELTIGLLTVYIAYLPKIHNGIIYFSSSNLKFRNEMYTHEKAFEALARTLEDEQFGISNTEELRDFKGNIEF